MQQDQNDGMHPRIVRPLRRPPSDWSGPWPTPHFKGGFGRYVMRKFVLGLEVAFAVLLAGTMVAADMTDCPIASALAGAALVVGAWAAYEGHRGNGRLRFLR